MDIKFILIIIIGVGLCTVLLYLIKSIRFLEWRINKRWEENLALLRRIEILERYRDIMCEGEKDE